MVRCESRAHNGESLIIRNPSMRLLIVEDDAPLASGLSRILEAEGHAVDVTERGEDAVLAASQEHFDLVILDMGVPRMEVLELLRRDGAVAQRAHPPRRGRHRGGCARCA